MQRVATRCCWIALARSSGLPCDQRKAAWLKLSHPKDRLRDLRVAERHASLVEPRELRSRCHWTKERLRRGKGVGPVTMQSNVSSVVHRPAVFPGHPLD